MGTRGLYVFKYKGIYYIFYNQFDSYTDGLGKLFIKDLKEIINSNQINEIKEYIINIPLNDGNDGSINYSTILGAIKYPNEFCYYTSNVEPNNDIFIEYIYIADLDDNKFIVKTCNNNYLKVDLYNIPDNWDEMLYDNESESCDNINISDDDIINLKIKILEANVKIYKLKLQLNKRT
jgi:hypothetical protein